MSFLLYISMFSGYTVLNAILFLFDHQNYTSTCEYYPINESGICVLQGEIQQLLLVDDPQAAADYCQDYIPDCDSPLPYKTQSLDPDEVSDSSVSVPPYVVKTI